jgi:hypothetical protein
MGCVGPDVVVKRKILSRRTSNSTRNSTWWRRNQANQAQTRARGHCAIQGQMSIFMKATNFLGYVYLPNVVVEWITLLLRFLEDQVSNIDPETGYTDRFFVFFSVPPGICGDSTSKLGNDVLFSPFFYILPFTYRHLIRLYIVWVTEKASLNIRVFSNMFHIQVQG